MRAPAEVRVRVVEGTQLSYGGTTYASGASISAPEHIAQRWIVRGWAEAKKPAAKPKPDPRTRAGARSDEHAPKRRPAVP